MSHLHNQNDHLPVLDPANDPEVVYAVTPEFSQFAFEFLSESSRILVTGDPAFEKKNNPPRRLMPELAELLERLFRETIVPAYVPLPWSCRSGRDSWQPSPPHNNPQDPQAAGRSPRVRRKPSTSRSISLGQPGALPIKSLVSRQSRWKNSFSRFIFKRAELPGKICRRGLQPLCTTKANPFPHPLQRGCKPLLHILSIPQTP
jgi:hypothetical protein